MVRYSRLERSRRGKMSYCNICTPVHRVAVPKALGLLYPKFWVQTLGMAALWTGVSVFLNLDTAFPLYFPVCVPRLRSVINCHQSRIRSCTPAVPAPTCDRSFYCPKFSFFAFIYSGNYSTGCALVPCQSPWWTLPMLPGTRSRLTTLSTSATIWSSNATMPARCMSKVTLRSVCNCRLCFN